MHNNLYWVINIVFAFVLFVILVNDHWINKSPDKVDSKFRNLTVCVLLFCLQDVVWGMCECGIISDDRIFFTSTNIFLMATVVTTFFWLDYVLAYLGEEAKHTGLILMIDGLLILYEVVLLFINIKEPILFRIENGRYVTGMFRTNAFLNQYIVYLIIGFVSLYFALKGKSQHRKKFFTVFVFALTPMISGILMLGYPDGPFYSIGYFLGCFMIHIFLVASEREKASKNNMLKSIADIYYSMHLFDLENDTAERYIESDILRKLIGDEGRPQIMINRVMNGTVSDEYLHTILEFVDLSTLSDRMESKNTISCEFVGKNYGWTRVSFIVVERDTYGKLNKVMVVTQIVDKEKKSQIDMLYKLNNDALTGLYNRRAYENDMDMLRSRPVRDNLVYVSIDINGLKNVNDTLGHAAGDELITGSADCMAKCLSSYGKIYRTGGDEFIAILYIESSEVERVLQHFQDEVNKWCGVLVKKLAVSLGYIKRADTINMSIDDIARLADDKMYKAKALYYSQSQYDRRSKRDNTGN